MKPVEYAAASEEVRAVYEDIMRTRGVEDVNNFWKYLANEPRMLKHVWESLKEIMGRGALDPVVKELIFVAVAITNNCEYCRVSHMAQARAKGATDEMLNEMIAVTALANMTNRLVNAYDPPVDEMFRD